MTCVTVSAVDPYAIARVLEESDQHRAAQLASMVHQMRVRGLSYTTIAKRLRLTPARTSSLHREHLAGLRALDAMGAMEADRRVQDERYETLLRYLWAGVEAGDLNYMKEARALLDSITAREVKITAMITASDPDTGTRTTLIAEGSTEEYIEALRGMSA